MCVCTHKIVLLIVCTHVNIVYDCLVGELNRTAPAPPTMPHQRGHTGNNLQPSCTDAACSSVCQLPTGKYMHAYYCAHTPRIHVTVTLSISLMAVGRAFQHLFSFSFHVKATDTLLILLYIPSGIYPRV